MIRVVCSISQNVFKTLICYVSCRLSVGGIPGDFLAAGNPGHLALALQLRLAMWGLISVSACGCLCGLRLSIQHPANELTH